MMKTVLIVLIRFYRKYVSPLKPPCCRFTPTCSTYALEAGEIRRAERRMARVKADLEVPSFP